MIQTTVFTNCCYTEHCYMDHCDTGLNIYRLLFTNMVIQWYKPLFYRLLLYPALLHEPLWHRPEYTDCCLQTWWYNDTNHCLTDCCYIEHCYMDHCDTGLNIQTAVYKHGDTMIQTIVLQIAAIQNLVILYTPLQSLTGHCYIDLLDVVQI